MAVALGLGFIKLTLSPLHRRQNLSSNHRSSPILFLPNKLHFTPKYEFSPSSLVANSTSIKPFLGPLIYDSKIKSHFGKKINLVGEDCDGLENSSLSKNLDDSGFLNLHNISTGHFDSNNNFGLGNGQGYDGGGTGGHITDYGTCSSSDDEEEERLHREWLSWWVWQWWLWMSPIRRLWNNLLYSSWRPLLKLIGLPPGLCTFGMANQTLIGGIVWNYIAGKRIVPVTLFLVRFGEFVLYFAALYVLELLVKGAVSLVSELGSRLRLWWLNRHNR